MPERFEPEVNPEKITKTEIVVCIPSYNEADAIAYPTTQADQGLVKYFGDKSSVIINCDNNSPDNTKQAFLDTATDTPKIYLSTHPGVKGKGNGTLRKSAGDATMERHEIIRFVELIDVATRRHSPRHFGPGR